MSSSSIKERDVCILHAVPYTEVEDGRTSRVARQMDEKRRYVNSACLSDEYVFSFSTACIGIRDNNEDMIDCKTIIENPNLKPGRIVLCCQGCRGKIVHLHLKLSLSNRHIQTPNPMLIVQPAKANPHRKNNPHTSIYNPFLTLALPPRYSAIIHPSKRLSSSYTQISRLPSTFDPTNPLLLINTLDTDSTNFIKPSLIHSPKEPRLQAP